MTENQELDRVDIPSTEGLETAMKQARTVVQKLRRANVKRLSGATLRKLGRMACCLEDQVACVFNECDTPELQDEAITIEITPLPEECADSFENFAIACKTAAKKISRKRTAGRFHRMARISERNHRYSRAIEARRNRRAAELDEPKRETTLTKQEFNKNFNRLNNKNVRNKVLKQCLDKKELKSVFPDGVPSLVMNLTVGDLDKLKRCIRVFQD